MLTYIHTRAHCGKKAMSLAKVFHGSHMILQLNSYSFLKIRYSNYGFFVKSHAQLAHFFRKNAVGNLKFRFLRDSSETNDAPHLGQTISSKINREPKIKITNGAINHDERYTTHIINTHPETKMIAHARTFFYKRLSFFWRAIFITSIKSIITGLCNPAASIVRH